jgi:diacylglycerol kinase (ATP)
VPGPAQVALFVNPTSGRGRGGRLLDPIASRLEEAGIAVRRIIGRNAIDASDLLRSAIAEDLDAVVAIGGDGMVHLAAQLLADGPIPLGVIPAGSGNDIARGLDIPMDPLAAADAVAEALAAGRVRAIDAVRAAEQWYVGVLGAGFDSRVNDRANRMSWPSGRSRYNMAIAAELRTFRPIPFTLTLDEQTWQTEAMLVAVGNGPTYGGGMRICDGAILDDALLDVTVLRPVSKLEFVRVFPRVYRGTHVTHPAVIRCRARTVALQAPDVTAYADGERLAALPVTCEIAPGALRVLTR